MTLRIYKNKKEEETKDHYTLEVRDDAQTLDIVKSASHAKKGYNSEEADIVAASTLNMSLEEYKKWRDDREEFDRRW
ncbi:MAG: hypothetical protein GY754_06295 [bacterium]|nr:hypothetical protein [bacterium]